MGCPKVTVTRIGRGSSYAEAVRDALDNARKSAAQICLQSNKECTLIDVIEIKEKVHNAKPWEVGLTVTFQCNSPKGCLFPFSFLCGGGGRSIQGENLDFSADSCGSEAPEESSKQ